MDAESYVVETPDHLVMLESLPPSGRSGGDHGTSSSDHSPFPGHRRMSKDSGRCSLTPTSDFDPQRRYSVDYSQYRHVSVDLERKEELTLAKEVRKSSVKMMRASPSWDSGDSQGDVTPTPANDQSPAETVPASPVVMRYWRQCAGAEDDEDTWQEDSGNDDNDQGNSNILTD